MTQLSQEQVAWSRNMQTQVLNALAGTCQQDIAETMGIDSGTITRLKDVHLIKLCNLLAALGLKIVPMELKCYNPEMVKMIYALARDNLMKSEEVDDFFHDDARIQIAEGTYKPRASVREVHIGSTKDE